MLNSHLLTARQSSHPVRQEKKHSWNAETSPSRGVYLPLHGLQSRGIKGTKEFSKEGAEGKLRKIVRMLLCSAQPWKDSLLSPRAPRGASLVPKGLCLAAGQAVPPREGGRSVQSAIQGPLPWQTCSRCPPLALAQQGDCCLQ